MLVGSDVFGCSCVSCVVLVVVFGYVCALVFGFGGLFAVVFALLVWCLFTADYCWLVAIGTCYVCAFMLGVLDYNFVEVCVIALIGCFIAF